MINLEKLKQKFVEVAEKNRLTLGVLFGSQATGRTHNQSDIDIGFVADHPLRPREIAELQEKLMVATGMGNIELVDFKAVSPLLLRIVAEEGLLLYEKEEGIFDRFKIYGIKLYMEAQPLLRLRARSVKDFIQKYA